MVTMSKTTFELNKKTNSQNDGVLWYKDGLHMATQCKCFEKPKPSYETRR
jgi:hypothetical protein